MKYTKNNSEHLSNFCMSKYSLKLSEIYSLRFYNSDSNCSSYSGGNCGYHGNVFFKGDRNDNELLLIG